jgi:hypothetical protein
MLVESGMLPALESALEKIPETERFGFEQESPDDNDDDPSELTGETEALASNKGLPKDLENAS